MFVVNTETRATECVSSTDARPSYKDLEALLRTLPWSMSRKSLLDRIQAEATFNKNSLGPPGA